MSGNTNASFQGIPNLTSPLTDGQGRMSQTWYRVFVSLFQRTGMSADGEAGAAGVGSVQNAVVFGQTAQGAGLPLKVYDAVTGKLLGTVTVTPP